MIDFETAIATIRDNNGFVPNHSRNAIGEKNLSRTALPIDYDTKIQHFSETGFFTFQYPCMFCPTIFEFATYKLRDSILFHTFETGGAIKLTATMQEREHTQKELDKLNACRDFLKQNGVFDQDSFVDFFEEE